MEKRLFTSESVTEGHPDKVCDAISDAILDACMAEDPMSRVACETASCTGFVLVTGEITTKAQLDIPAIVRKTVNEIGYNDAKTGFDGNTCAVMVALDQQSPDIAMGVDKALEAKEGALTDDLDTGAGDVWLCNQRDTGVNAISDLFGTQTGITVNQSKKRRHTDLLKTGRKDTGFRRVR